LPISGRCGTGNDEYTKKAIHGLPRLQLEVKGEDLLDRLDKNPLEVIKTGDYVKVDGDAGTVEVMKKAKA